MATFTTEKILVTAKFCLCPSKRKELVYPTLVAGVEKVELLLWPTRGSKRFDLMTYDRTADDVNEGQLRLTKYP